jgi:hypothetical protein
MVTTKEVRCENCGTLNRVRAYSFRQIPNCGSCHKPLPETAAIEGLRDLYRWRSPLMYLAVVASTLLFFVWVESHPHETAITSSAAPADSCAKRPAPREGVYKWYGPMWGQDIAELTISTAIGSDYFVKLVDMSGNAARAYFLHGGSTETFPVPQSWCGESDLFGQSTATSKADDTFTFESDTHWTVELILQPHGNLGTHSIPRSEF